MIPTDTDTAPDFAALSEELVESGQTMTVTRIDGKHAVGTLAPHPTEPGVYKVVTGRRGRPFTFHPDDVDSIVTE